MHYYTHEDVKKAVTLGKLKIMKHPNLLSFFLFIEPTWRKQANCYRYNLLSYCTYQETKVCDINFKEAKSWFYITFKVS